MFCPGLRCQFIEGFAQRLLRAISPIIESVCVSHEWGPVDPLDLVANDEAGLCCWRVRIKGDDSHQWALRDHFPPATEDSDGKLFRSPRPGGDYQG